MDQDLREYIGPGLGCAAGARGELGEASWLIKPALGIFGDHGRLRSGPAGVCAAVRAGCHLVLVRAFYFWSVRDFKFKVSCHLLQLGNIVVGTAVGHRLESRCEDEKGV